MKIIASGSPTNNVAMKLVYCCFILHCEKTGELDPSEVTDQLICFPMGKCSKLPDTAANT